MDTLTTKLQYQTLEYGDEPVKLKPLVSRESLATPSSISHFPTITQEPQITVRSMTVEPARSPMPTDTWLCAVSVLPDSPDTEKSIKITKSKLIFSNFNMNENNIVRFHI